MGLAYKDMVNIQLDEVDEYAYVVAKEYNISYEYIMDKMYYSDLTVMYAKIANEKAFTSYEQYMSLEDEQKGKYVSDYGEPKPYAFELLTREIQEAKLDRDRKSVV